MTYNQTQEIKRKTKISSAAQLGEKKTRVFYFIFLFLLKGKRNGRKPELFICAAADIAKIVRFFVENYYEYFVFWGFTLFEQAERIMFFFCFFK